MTRQHFLKMALSDSARLTEIVTTLAPKISHKLMLSS